MIDAEVQHLSYEGEDTIGHDRTATVYDRINELPNVAPGQFGNGAIAPAGTNFNRERSLILGRSPFEVARVSREVFLGECSYGVSARGLRGAPLVGGISPLVDIAQRLPGELACLAKTDVRERAEPEAPLLPTEPIAHAELHHSARQDSCDQATLQGVAEISRSGILGERAQVFVGQDL